jgi:hypothetical protein
MPAWLLDGAAAGVIAKLGLISQEASDLPFHARIEQWHDFFLMAGTAAVTLAGLLFVALSLHLDRLVETHHEHLLALSRATLTSFLMVLILSMFMLVPPMSARMTGLMILIAGLAGSALSTLQLSRVRHHDEGGFTRAQMRRRTMVPAIGYVLLLSAGFGVWIGAPDLMFNLVGGVCMLLLNAAGTSWELLVRVAKSKRG